MRRSKIIAIEHYLPEITLSNKTLENQFPNWPAEKIVRKTGIEKRHLARENECASDLAEKAAIKLFKSGICTPQDIEFIVLCTQSPDYFLPTTACLLQDRLGIKQEAGAFDFNLGCSGYIYGLSIAKGLIETHQVNNVLLITAETYSKYLDDNDVSTRTIFGDGATATYIEAEKEGNNSLIGPFVFGTDGSGKDNLIVKNGASKHRADHSVADKLFMNGPAIFSFTIKTLPNAINQLLKKANMSIHDIDHFIFHQANEYILSHLRDKINIPSHKFYINLKNYGNTVSSSIPIALQEALSTGVVKKEDRVMLVGFGVGYSWSACLIYP